MANNGILSLSPLARDWLKVVAFASMVTDHAAIVFGWQAEWLHMVGRAAMPLFALVWGSNVALHPVSLTSLRKTWMWAVLAQPVFFLALQSTGQAWYQLNILFLFAVSGLVMYALDRQAWPPILLAALSVACWVPLSAASYGLRGIVLMVASVVLFRVSTAWQLPALTGWFLAVLVLNLPNGLPMALAGVSLALLLTGLCACYLKGHTRLRITRWFAPAYAFHLGLLFVLAPFA